MFNKNSLTKKIKAIRFLVRLVECLPSLTNTEWTLKKMNFKSLLPKRLLQILKKTLLPFMHNNGLSTYAQAYIHPEMLKASM